MVGANELNLERPEIDGVTGKNAIELGGGKKIVLF